MLKFKGDTVAEISISIEDIIKNLSLPEKADVISLVLGECRGYADADYKENREEREGVLRLMTRDQKIYLIKIIAESLLYG